MPTATLSWLCPYFLALMFVGTAVTAACFSEDVGTTRIVIAAGVLIFMAYLCGIRQHSDHCER